MTTPLSSNTALPPILTPLPSPASAETELPPQSPYIPIASPTGALLNPQQQQTLDRTLKTPHQFTDCDWSWNIYDVLRFFIPFVKESAQATVELRQGINILGGITFKEDVKTIISSMAAGTLKRAPRAPIVSSDFLEFYVLFAPTSICYLTQDLLEQFHQFLIYLIAVQGMPLEAPSLCKAVLDFNAFGDEKPPTDPNLASRWKYLKETTEMIKKSCQSYLEQNISFSILEIPLDSHFPLKFIWLPSLPEAPSDPFQFNIESNPDKLVYYNSLASGEQSYSAAVRPLLVSQNPHISSQIWQFYPKGSQDPDLLIEVAPALDISTLPCAVLSVTQLCKSSALKTQTYIRLLKTYLDQLTRYPTLCPNYGPGLLSLLTGALQASYVTVDKKFWVLIFKIVAQSDDVNTFKLTWKLWLQKNPIAEPSLWHEAIRTCLRRPHLMRDEISNFLMSIVPDLISNLRQSTHFREISKKFLEICIIAFWSEEQDNRCVEWHKWEELFTDERLQLNTEDKTENIRSFLDVKYQTLHALLLFRSPDLYLYNQGSSYFQVIRNNPSLPIEEKLFVFHAYSSNPHFPKDSADQASLYMWIRECLLYDPSLTDWHQAGVIIQQLRHLENSAGSRGYCYEEWELFMAAQWKEPATTDLSQFLLSEGGCVVAPSTIDKAHFFHETVCVVMEALSLNNADKLSRQLTSMHRIYFDFIQKNNLQDTPEFNEFKSLFFMKTFRITGSTDTLPTGLQLGLKVFKTLNKSENLVSHFADAIPRILKLCTPYDTLMNLIEENLEQMTHPTDPAVRGSLSLEKLYSNISIKLEPFVMFLLPQEKSRALVSFLTKYLLSQPFEELTDDSIKPIFQDLSVDMIKNLIDADLNAQEDPFKQYRFSLATARLIRQTPPKAAADFLQYAQAKIMPLSPSVPPYFQLVTHVEWFLALTMLVKALPSNKPLKQQRKTVIQNCAQLARPLFISKDIKFLKVLARIMVEDREILTTLHDAVQIPEGLAPDIVQKLQFLKTLIQNKLQKLN